MISDNSLLPLSSTNVPRYIRVLDEPQPRKASGKFVKKDLQNSLNHDDDSTWGFKR